MKPPPQRYLEGDPLLFKVLNEIGICAQLSRAAYDRAAGERISNAGFGVLNHLARIPGEKNPAQLARAFQVTKGAMTNTLQRLGADGYVRITPDAEDGRVARRYLMRDEQHPFVPCSGGPQCAGDPIARRL